MTVIAGKVAFITGAASGIGLAVASAMMRAGARVMLCDRDAKSLEGAVARLRAEGGDVDGVCADVSVKEELSAAAEATVAWAGKVHILVNNAGVAGGGMYGTWSDPAWEWVMAVNVMGPIWGAEIFVPLIEAHGEGGHVVNVASMAGLVTEWASAYGVSKAAIVSLTEGLRVQLAPRGIGVSLAAPGMTRTRIARTSQNPPERFKGAVAAPPVVSLKQRAALLQRLEQGDDPDHVADLVCQGVEGNWPYIFNDLEFEPAIEARFAAIKQGFDRVRAQRT